ncbi:hypothetical protein [uncultured Deinococcus sp.]|uniref:hypothetical protein n=1 Tax=uncultured Deinococcus sp. TaxID=158789 RepID=UPI0037490D31
MLDIYLICLIVGGGLLALSLLGGHDTDLGGHAPEAEHGGGGGHLAPWFSLRALVSFVAFFGLAGVVGGLMGLGGAARLVMALVTGLAVGGFTAFAFGVVRARGEVGAQAGRLAGRTGQVVVPPAPARPGHPERLGKVALTVGGQLEQRPARSADDLRPGDPVLVIAEERGVLEVKFWDGA